MRKSIPKRRHYKRSSKKHLLKVISTLRKSLRTWLKKRQRDLRPDLQMNARPWRDSCKLRLRRTYSLRSLSMRSKMLTGLWKVAWRAMIDPFAKKFNNLSATVNKFPICTNKLSTRNPSSRLKCKLRRESCRRVWRNSNSWRRSSWSRGTRTNSWKR